MTPPVIEAHGVARRYGAVRAVDDVSLHAGRGEILGLIGHNGAGKSTLLRMLLGLLAPDAGSIRVLGVAVQGAGFRDVRRRIGYLPENVVFYDNLSGAETLRFYAELKGVPVRECAPLLEEVGLAGAAHRAVRGYSRGMRQRLGLAQALLGAPQLVILDEPTTGLDPVGVREFYGILARLRARGTTVLLSSHNLAEIQDRVDRLALMRMGRLQASGTVQALREELDLPVHVRVTLRPGTEPALRAALAALAGCALHLDAGRAGIDCARRQKMPLLATLMALPDVVLDVQMHEPTLEDVFLGYVETDRAPAAREDA